MNIKDNTINEKGLNILNKSSNLDTNNSSNHDIDVNVNSHKLNSDAVVSDNIKMSNFSKSKIDFLMDIPVNLTIELGTIKIKIKDLLDLPEKSILVLDKHVGEPLNILINGCLIAMGELVVKEDKYGIRITNVFENSNDIQNSNK
ncbi:MAG: flagellar motor switch protein FliN [Buchnera aphidicola (Chaetogeoica yunlongensis)]